MTDLADRSTGDIITSADQNLMVDYIQDGTHKINTLSLSLGGTEIITSAFAVTNVISATIVQTSVSGSALSITRDLDSENTDAAVAYIIQTNVNDDMACLELVQDGTTYALNVTRSTTGSTVLHNNEVGGVGTRYNILCRDDNSVGDNLFYRDLDSTKTIGPMVMILQTNALNDQDALFVQQDGTDGEGITSRHYGSAGAAISAQAWDNEAYDNYANLVNMSSKATGDFSRNLDSLVTCVSVVSILQTNALDDQPALNIQQDGNADALQINTTATMDGEYGIRIDATSASTTVDAAGGIRIAGGSARGIYCVRDSTSAYTTGAVAAIIQDNASDDQPALSIQQNGAGDSGVKITHNNAAGYGLDITSIGANQYAALRSICTTTSGMAAAIEKNVASSTYPTLRVAQYHATGGQPVVELRQVDISEGFIDFVGTDTGAVATSTTNSNASVTVEVNGTKYKIPLFAV